MNQPVRYVAMVVAILISAGEAFALDTVLSPLYIAGKIGVSAMSASDIANTSGAVGAIPHKDRFSQHRRAGRSSDRVQLAQARSASPY